MATSVPMGIVSLKAEGTYAADKLYKKGMWVTSSGSSYAYINPTPSTNVPLTDASHWQQIAEKGDTGDPTSSTASDIPTSTAEVSVQGALDGFDSQLAQKANKESYYIDLTDYCILDGVSDDTTNLERAIVDGKAQNRGLYLPSNKTLKITRTVNASFLDIDFKGYVVVDMTDGIGLIIGDTSYYARRRSIFIRDIVNSVQTTERSDTQFSLQIQGLKVSTVTILRCDSLRLYADGDTLYSTDNRIDGLAYNTFTLGVIDFLYIFSKKTAEEIGWINENLFLCGGRLINIEIDGNYRHEQNIFIKPDIEGGSLWVKKGNANVFRDLRTENGTVKFEREAIKNIVISSFYTQYIDYQERNIVEYDHGLENMVVTNLEMMYQKYPVFDLIPNVTYFSNFVSKYKIANPENNVALSTDGNYIEFPRYNHLFEQTIDTSVIKRFRCEVTKDSNKDYHAVMYYIQCFDENMNIIPDPSDPNDPETFDIFAAGIHWNDGSKKYLYTANVGTMDILVSNPEVKFINFQIQSGVQEDVSFKFQMSRLTLFAYTPIYATEHAINIEHKALDDGYFNKTFRSQMVSPLDINYPQTPRYIGEDFFDTTNKKWYKATGLNEGDWVALN